MKTKRKKMDRYFIAINQPHELDWAVEKMKSEGIIVTRDEVGAAHKKVGKSRRAIYKELRSL